MTIFTKERKKIFKFCRPVLLEHGLRFVQKCCTCNSVKKQIPFVHGQMKLPNTSLWVIELVTYYT